MSNSPWINRSFTIFCFMTELFKCKQFIRKKSGPCQIWETETNLTGTAEVCFGRRHGFDSKLISYILIFEIKTTIPSLPLHCPLPFLLGLWLGLVLPLLLSGPWAYGFFTWYSSPHSSPWILLPLGFVEEPFLPRHPTGLSLARVPHIYFPMIVF